MKCAVLFLSAFFSIKNISYGLEKKSVQAGKKKLRKISSSSVLFLSCTGCQPWNHEQGKKYTTFSLSRVYALVTIACAVQKVAKPSPSPSSNSPFQILSLASLPQVRHGSFPCSWPINFFFAGASHPTFVRGNIFEG